MLCRTDFYSLNISIVEMLLNGLISTRSTVMNGVGILHSRNPLSRSCGSGEIYGSRYSQSGYDQLVSLFSNFSAPLFFSEYGCNLVEPREFTEVGAICTPPPFPLPFSIILEEELTSRLH